MRFQRDESSERQPFGMIMRLTISTIFNWISINDSIDSIIEFQIETFSHMSSNHFNNQTFKSKNFEFYWKLLIKLMTQLAIQSLGRKFGFQASRKWSCWISAALNWFHFERLSNEFFNWIWNRKIRLLLSNKQGLSDSKFAGRAHHSTISGHDGIPQDWQASSTWMLNQFHHLITFV